MDEMKAAVTLNRLKVDPPRGSPVIDPKTGRQGILRHARAVRVTVLWDDCDHEQFAMRADVALDLTTRVGRIDGATIAATMLAESARLDVSRGVTWDAERICGEAHVRIRDGHGRWHGIDGPTTGDVDPRALLAAVLVATLEVKS